MELRYHTMDLWRKQWVCILLNDVRTLLITVQLQLSLYEGCHRVYNIFTSCTHRNQFDPYHIYVMHVRKEQTNMPCKDEHQTLTKKIIRHQTWVCERHLPHRGITKRRTGLENGMENRIENGTENGKVVLNPY